MRLALFVALAALNATPAQASQNPGLPFLMIWPTPRSTAMSGAAVAFPGDADLAYWNPGAAGLVESFSAEMTGGPWLPGLCGGMSYLFAAGNYAGRIRSLPGLAIGGHAIYMPMGETEVVNERGEFLGRYTAWDGSFGVHGGLGFLQGRFGIGVGLKLAVSYLVPDWVWRAMPELGIDDGGTAANVAADLGLLHRPSRSLSWGLVLANFGPDVDYGSPDESAPLPRMFRLGLNWTLFENEFARLRISPQVDKLLVGMFDDPEGTRTFSQLLKQELRSAWKAVGFELTFYPLSVRLGYFEDLKGQRGGIVFERDGTSSHYGIADILQRRNLGKYKSIGLTWGVGIGWKDYLRVDLSSDAMIYDFPTTNWKLGLVVNDFAGLVREVSKLHDFKIARWPPLPKGEYAPAPREMVYTGSGVLLSDSGLFATCNHVIENAVSIEVFFPDRDTSFSAMVLARDVSNDLAVLQLKIPAGLSLPPVTFALQEPGDARMGMRTFTLGYPISGILGTSPRYSAGSVSALTGIHDDAARLQIQNPIQPGNSGGPLFGEDGRMAGVVVSSLNYRYMLHHNGDLPENVNFAVKIGHLRNLLAELPEGRRVLARRHGLVVGKTEDVVEQLRPFIGLVRVKARE